MTGLTGDKKSANDLDKYFNSRVFINRLDYIRRRYKDAGELKAIAMGIQHNVHLKLNHIPIIYYYLLTGKHEPILWRSSIEIIDRGVPKKKPIIDPEDGVEYSFDTDDIGVAIELTKDTTKPELQGFIDENWKAIKAALDRNYSHSRIKSFKAPDNIDKYLAVAEKLVKFEQQKHDKIQHANKIAELACDYNMEISDVSKQAKKYSTFFKEPK